MTFLKGYKDYWKKPPLVSPTRLPNKPSSLMNFLACKVVLRLKANDVREAVFSARCGEQEESINVTSSQHHR